jgi:hypothetical protein
MDLFYTGVTMSEKMQARMCDGVQDDGPFVVEVTMKNKDHARTEGITP